MLKYLQILKFKNMKSDTETGAYSLSYILRKKVDWTSPNTYVFLGVQVIGIVWFLWLVWNHFFSRSLIPNSILITSCIMILMRYIVGMWFVTAWRHRYFAHRSFKLREKWKWLEVPIAFICSMDAQRGVCQWAAEHIWHHKYSDQPEDLHSCKETKSKLWCHMFWVLKKTEEIKWELIPQLKKSKLIVWIEDKQWVGIILGGGIFSFIGANLFVSMSPVPGQFLHHFIFSLFAYFFATTLLWHGTFLINSAMHLIGKQPYKTGDESRNSLICAILTLGEGWHNNHHWDYPTVKRARELAGSVDRSAKGLYWQGKTTFQKCFDWSGASIWLIIERGFAYE
jgi:stearoyl-CoA desaturase (delta-9 desaturase)